LSTDDECVSGRELALAAVSVVEASNATAGRYDVDQAEKGPEGPH
jgi:hypothetical protein